MRPLSRLAAGVAAAILSVVLLTAPATTAVADDSAAVPLPSTPPASAQEFSLSPELQAKSVAARASFCDTYVNRLPPGGTIIDHYRLPASGSSLNCVLETGVSSTGVWVLQLALNACYGRGLVTDGIFGPATYNAVMYVQTIHGIGVDGVYGNQTRNAMRWPKTATGSNCIAGSNF